MTETPKKNKLATTDNAAKTKARKKKHVTVLLILLAVAVFLGIVLYFVLK